VTSDPAFKVTTFLTSNIRKTARLKDKVTIAQQESIPNIWNDTMFGDLDWPLNASRGFVVRCYYIRVRTEHLRWFSKIFQDLLWCVFHDFPGPRTLYTCRSTSFITQSTFTTHCYKLVSHFASNVPVVTYANVFTNSTKYRMWPKFFTVYCLVIIQRSSKKISHELFAFPWLFKT